MHFKKLIVAFWKGKSEGVYKKIKPYLKKGDKILDIGAGSCQISEMLIKNGFDVVPLDIRNLSVVDGLSPVIYDGENIPFKNDYFDVSLLITTLHHVKEPESFLKEAKRVSKGLIIIEDIYHGPIQKYLTYIMDNVVNIEFFGHPHSNKNDNEWKNTFKKLGLSLKDSKYEKFWGIFWSAVYYLKRERSFTRN